MKLADQVAIYGLDFLREEEKGRTLRFFLSFYHGRIQAIRELQHRSWDCGLTADRIEHLTYLSTGNRDKASMAKARFILDSTRKSKNG